QPAHPQAHRGRLWLDEDYRRSQKDKISRAGKGRMVLHHGGRRLISSGYPSSWVRHDPELPVQQPRPQTNRCTSWHTDLIPITDGNFFNGLLGYKQRFGGLLEAYKRVGHAPERDYRFLDFTKHRRRARLDTFNQIATAAEDLGAVVA